MFGIMRRHSLEKIEQLGGKAKPFRTESGTAASVKDSFAGLSLAKG
jgi:hypothetical protein